MKNIIKITIVALLFSSCQDMFLDIDPPASKTEEVEFKTPADFQENANSMLGGLLGWKSPYGTAFEFMDCASDLSSTMNRFNVSEGTGNLIVPDSDGKYNNSYGTIRSANIMLQKAQEYEGDIADIDASLGVAYFFRAWGYYHLLKWYGGVPIILRPLDTSSDELYAPRNSRYEVVDLIFSDLQNAIDRLPEEASIADNYKGSISKEAAQVFKAKVLLFEATWRKYNGTETDFEGSAGPKSDQISNFLTEAVELSKAVMDCGSFELWSKNSELDGEYSNYFLFNLEDEGSNPAGLTKASNKEFILYSVYDFALRQGGINLSQTMTRLSPSRKMMDMFVCTDGLPISKSPLFQGYHAWGDEYINRDSRMLQYTLGTEAIPVAGSYALSEGWPGYGIVKYATYNDYRADNTESANYPIIRLAEVYLTYAEALVELNGSMTDEELNASINRLRGRAGVSGITNALISDNNLDWLEEIRRERSVELYMENTRYDDLKRWGILAESLGASRLGAVVGGVGYPTDFKNGSGAATSLYTPSDYVFGEEEYTLPNGVTTNCVVLSAASSHSFEGKKEYLYPIPAVQLQLNRNLVQNPGY